MRNMPTRNSTAYLAVFVVALFTGCAQDQADRRSVPTPQPTFANRPLIGTTASYAIYGLDDDSAELTSWLDSEIREFCSSQGVEEVPKGIVIALEPGCEEPSEALSRWRKRHAEPTRYIFWASRTQWELLFAKRRPYVLAQAPYFRESFDIPRCDAAELGLDEQSEWRPLWVVALATTPHFDGAFARRVEENELAARQHLASASPALRAANATTMIVLRAFKPWIQARILEVDRELMVLQRREALHESLIGALVADGDEQAKLRNQLRRETDQTWKRIWMSRPKW